MKKIRYLKIKQVTWKKDSHGLFDYETKVENLEEKSHFYEQSLKVYKKNQGPDCLFVTDGRIPPDSTYLVSLQKDEKADRKNFLSCIIKEFVMRVEENPNVEKNSQNAFLAIRCLKKEDKTPVGYPLTIGDVIRVGRIEYRVIEIQDDKKKRMSLYEEKYQNMSKTNSNDPKSSLPFEIDIKECVKAGKDKDDGTEFQCRVCLDNHDEPENPLLSPCLCKGTQKYIHSDCLKQWLKNKLKRDDSMISSCFHWKKLICELCKYPLPDLVKYCDRKIEIVPLVRPESPYIIVERIFYDKSKETADNTKTLVVLTITDKESVIKLGRGQDCQLRESDISVSRIHALIKLENSQFVISDHGSKFGTLILVRKNYQIEKRKRALQIGRTVLTFSITKNPEKH